MIFIYVMHMCDFICHLLAVSITDEDDQELSIQYFEALAQSSPDGEVGKTLKRCLDFAARHKVVIDKFGRYPHRNAILERESTPEEMEYLNQPGSSF